MSFILLTINRILEETYEAKRFEFSATEPLHYEAGQFLSFVFTRNGREYRRSYSLCSAPSANEPLSVTLKRVPNGLISRWWIDEAKVGDRVWVLPPAGLFTLPAGNDVAMQVFFFAAGSGISPVFSLIKEILLTRPTWQIVLVYSNSSEEKTIFKEALKYWQTLYPQSFQIEWLFSNHANLMRARLSTYILQDILNRYRMRPWAQVVAYTCGPYDYMQMVRVNLFTMGLAPAHFRREIFDDVIPSSMVRRYYDETDRTIIIHYAGEAHSLLVPHKQSILDAALNAGINLPYSCKGGRCSTCRCKVLQGKVWMHYNEVLTDEDENNGWALTCTGHPMTGDLVIAFT